MAKAPQTSSGWRCWSSAWLLSWKLCPGDGLLCLLEGAGIWPHGHGWLWQTSRASEIPARSACSWSEQLPCVAPGSCPPLGPGLFSRRFSASVRRVGPQLCWTHIATKAFMSHTSRSLNILHHFYFKLFLFGPFYMMTYFKVTSQVKMILTLSQVPCFKDKVFKKLNIPFNFLKM